MARIDKAKLEEVSNDLANAFGVQYPQELENRLAQARGFAENPYKEALIKNESTNEQNFNAFKDPINAFLQTLAETCGFVLKVESADMTTTQEVEIDKVETITTSDIPVF